MTSTLIRTGAVRADDRSLGAILVGDGRPLLGLFAIGLVLAGAFAWFLSAVSEALPHELRFLGLSLEQLRALADGRVADFMTHDRAGLLVLGLVRWGTWSKSLWLALAIAGGLGFGAAIGIHGLVGYLDATHVGPAVAGAIVFAVGMWLSRPRGGALGAGRSWRRSRRCRGGSVAARPS